MSTAESDEPRPAVKTKRGRPNVVNRERILGVARSLGLRDLTMHAVAVELGVSTPALYHYFPNKKELLSALAGEYVAELSEPVDSGQGWRVWMIESGASSFEMLERFPEAVQYMNATPPADAQLEMMDRGFEQLLQAGFTPENARSAMDLLTRFIFKAAHSNETTLTNIEKLRPDLHEPQSDEWLLSLRRVARTSADRDPKEVFELELECLLHGIEHLLGPQSK
jgi:AcrR family transcriptional regulator